MVRHCLPVNTGCRDAEICGLRWDWEVEVPALCTSVFIIPTARVKNGDDRLVVLNSAARSVVQARRGLHVTHVFSYQGLPMRRMLTSAWKRARQCAGLPLVRVRPQTHLWSTAARGRGRVRGPSGSAWASFRAHHNALFSGGAIEAPRGC
jgi:integrase